MKIEAMTIGRRSVIGEVVVSERQTIVTECFCGGAKSFAAHIKMGEHYDRTENGIVLQAV